MWVPLHLHSQYSVLDATPAVEKIAKKAAHFGLPACALTDHGNMHGAIDFYKACMSEGVKPIVGCEVYVAPQGRFEKKKHPVHGKSAYHLILLAKNETGYRNLATLSSLGFLEGFYYHPRIDKELLQKHAEGLICLSACLSGSVAMTLLHGSREEFLEEIAWHRSLFGEDYYLEIQRHEMEERAVQSLSEPHLVALYEEFIAKQRRVNAALIDVSAELKIPLVATNDTHYLEPEDWQAHEIVLNIQSGEPVEIWEKDGFGNNKFRVPNPKRRVYATRELYFKSAEQMQERFKDLPQALATSLEIADKCHLSLDFKTKHYPLYLPPALQGKSFSKREQTRAVEEFLKGLCLEGIEKRYTPHALEKVAEKYPGRDPLEVVKERLERELSLITSKEMCDYLLIVWDFINWAKNKGIPVGPGRGSGAGSIILYLIGVTDIEPLRFHLLFERFINPERVSYPDIDVDICMARRGDVIDYTVGKYGKENVAQIITFGTMKAKMAIKDVGRVLSIPLAHVNAIAKLVPEDPQMTLAKALEIDVDLHRMYEEDEDAKKIIDLAKKLEGSIRNTGIHAAGIIVSAEKLMRHIPICLAKESSMQATQYSMKPLEMVGMLKIDFLGLKTLTGIERAVQAIAENHGVKIDWVNLPLEDGATFRLLQQGRTQGVFQMESGGMQELAKQLQPDRFEEIIAIGALYRPGPMDMIPSFISRKHKREPIEYDHPKLVPILAETYGIMVYQEQVMQIATDLASYSLGQGDVLRRAMGKKDGAQMAKEREKFLQGALQNGIGGEQATAIFDKIEKFASYGFNKSHAAAYGYLTYVTAYLKAHYPEEWMAALMTCDSDDLSKVAKCIRECQALEIPVLPPDINESGKEFVATKRAIRFAMSGIKGVGEGIVELILEERGRRGPFSSFYDFFKRVDIKKVGKKTVEMLVEAGCFDCTRWSRDALRLRIEEMYDFVLKNQEDAARGVMTFFSLIGDAGEKKFLEEPAVTHPTARSEGLRKEKERLGFFLTGHPMDHYRKLMEQLSCLPLSKLEEQEHNKVVRLAFIVETVTVRISTKSQKKFAILTISDGMEAYELPIWPELYEEKGALLNENQLLYAVVQVDKREESLRLNCQWLGDLTQVDEAMIAACDAAYDRAKQRTQRFQPKATQTTPPELVKGQHVTCRVDLLQIRLSHLLKMKELFSRLPGNASVKIEFHVEGTLHSTLILNEKVALSDSLTMALRGIGGGIT